MIEDGVFTWAKPFWEQGLWRWDAMFNAGVRAQYQASQLAAKGMVANQSGLIVNISFWAAQKHIRERRIWSLEGGHRQDDCGHGRRTAYTRRCSVVAIPGVGEDGKRDGGGSVARPHQFRIP